MNIFLTIVTKETIIYMFYMLMFYSGGKNEEYKKIVITVMIVSMTLGMYPVNEVLATSKCLSTDYTNYKDVGGIFCYTIREKVKTYHDSYKTTKGKLLVLGTVTNTKKKKCKMTGTYSKTRSRTYSIAAKTPTNILKKVVDISIGGALTYSQTVTLSATVTVKGKSAYTFYYRVNTRTDKYKHVVQKQSNKFGAYKNEGAEFKRYSNVYSKTPEIIV